MIPTFFTIGAAMLGFASAFLWIKTATVEVTADWQPPEDEPNSYPSGLIRSEATGRTIDLWETSKSRFRWLQRAALFTGISTLCQAVALMNAT